MKEFQERFKEDKKVNPMNATPLSKDINDVDNDVLTKEVINEEIVEALKQTNLLKALGPDGVQSIFDHKKWDIAGKSVCNIVRSFFKFSHMLK